MVRYKPEARRCQLTFYSLVCALQYVATAKILLALSSPEPQNESCSSRLDLVQKLTVEVCGLAFTNEDLAATINGFGPLLFCMLTFH